MATNRIYLGVDAHSNLAVSLEPAGSGNFIIRVSEGAAGKEVCHFTCPGETLESLGSNAVEVEGSEGKCSLVASGDAIVIEVKRKDRENEPSVCALSANSFHRVLRLARNRAYIG